MHAVMTHMNMHELDTRMNFTIYSMNNVHGILMYIYNGICVHIYCMIHVECQVANAAV